MGSRLALPRSRSQIREIADLVRWIVKKEKSFYFDIVRFIEHVLPKIEEDFILRICSEDEMSYCEGLTSPSKGIMNIREDVYYGAIAGNGRDRFTIAHELGHYILHKEESICYARNEKEKYQKFRDPEWQADAFAGELLIPSKLITGLTVDEVVELCSVSYSAASYQLRKTIN